MNKKLANALLKKLMMRALGALLLLRALPVLGAGSSWTPATDPAAAYGPELQGFEHPYPIMRFEFASQGQSLHMAYMCSCVAITPTCSRLRKLQRAASIKS